MTAAAVGAVEAHEADMARRVEAGKAPTIQTEAAYRILAGVFLAPRPVKPKAST